MRRRGFLRLLGGAPALPVVAAIPVLEPDVVITTVQTPDPTVVINFNAPVPEAESGRMQRRAQHAMARRLAEPEGDER